MKKLFINSLCILAFTTLLWQTAAAQVMLQRAVVSNGGSIGSNGTTNGAFIVGQTATGTAHNGQTVGQFGFFTAPAAVNSVAGQGAGSISSVQVMPNPASNEVSINVTLASADNIDLFLYDASGHLISTIFSGKKEAGIFTQRLDVKSLASGAYFIAARIPGALVQSKLNVVK